MVTKRQQLKWLAKRFESLPFDGDSILMSDEVLGYIGYEHKITNQELMQERDMMQKKAQQAAQPSQDNSWYERGELSPAGVPVELWWGGSFAYNCEFITRRGRHYVMWNLDADRPDAADYMNSEFRPLSLLNPLSIEREKAIYEMVKLIGHGYMSAEMAKELAVKMHDSGYHK